MIYDDVSGVIKKVSLSLDYLFHSGDSYFFVKILEERKRGSFVCADDMVDKSNLVKQVWKEN